MDKPTVNNQAHFDSLGTPLSERPGHTAACQRFEELFPWECDCHVKAPPAAPEIPTGMVAWSGGDEAPADWDKGSVLLRGGTGCVGIGVFRWDHQGFDDDIIAYTPTARPAATAGGEEPEKCSDPDCTQRGVHRYCLREPATAGEVERVATLPPAPCGSDYLAGWCDGQADLLGTPANQPATAREMDWANAHEKASVEVERLQRELDITNADHIVLWLEANKDDSSLGWLACRIIEAHEQGLALAALASDRGEIERLREAAQAVIDNADRPGSRMCFGGGENGEDVWIDHLEVDQPVLDRLSAALSERPVPYQAETDRSSATEQLRAALPKTIGRLSLGDQLSEEHYCAGSHDMPDGQPIYWTESIGEYPDDIDGYCITCAIQRAESEAGWCECSIQAARADADGAADVVAPDAGEVKRLTGLLRELALTEADYRAMHDLHGDDSKQAGRAWDSMRRAGDKARAALGEKA